MIRLAAAAAALLLKKPIQLVDKIWSCNCFNGIGFPCLNTDAHGAFSVSYTHLTLPTKRIV